MVKKIALISRVILKKTFVNSIASHNHDTDYGHHCQWTINTICTRHKSSI